jgi:hypothetical protein
MSNKIGGGLCALFFLYVAFGFARMSVAGVRTGTIQLYVGRYTSRRAGPPRSRTEEPQAFWLIVWWYAFLSAAMVGCAAACGYFATHG